LPRGALDLERHGAQHLPQRREVDVIGLHNRLGQRIAKQIVNCWVATETWHWVSPFRKVLKINLGIDKRRQGVTSK
jgi:hypothetical protein